MKRLFRDRRGSVAVYSAVFLTFAAGIGTLAVDFGRVSVLKSQMQNYADAAALAGAVQLDARDGARARATAVATNAASGGSGIAADGAAFQVQSIQFYSAVTPSAVLATSDSDAAYISVTLAPKRIDLLFQPAMNLFTGKASATSRTVTASAMAMPDPYICHAPPLMLCDLSEEDPSLDLRLPEHAGKMVRLKEPQAGDGTMAPGNFGLLSLPDGSSGASDIEGALAAVEPEDCYTLDLTTATGSKTQKARSGLNARFDLPGGYPYPAPNVINYPRDNDLIVDEAAKLGDGTWDINGYWMDKHGSALPPSLAGASRYQVYLYELGETFARDGKRTIYPIEDSLPSGFTTVTPPAVDIPATTDPALTDDPDYDGEPSQQVASNGPARRLVQVALLQCIADGVHGKGTYPSHGRYVEMFITEEVREPPAAAFYGEVVRGVSSAFAPDFHANVRLVQ